MKLACGGAAAAQLARFVLVGAGAAALLFVLAWGFVALGAPPFGSGIAAYAIAFVAAYSAHRAWTFGARHAHRTALPRYLAVQLGCGLASGALAHVAVHGAGASPAVMSALVTVAASAASFMLTSRWVFRKGAHD